MSTTTTGFREYLKNTTEIPVTKEMLTEYLCEIFSTEKSNQNAKLFFPIGEVSPGLYKLPNGVFTTETSWKVFCRELKKLYDTGENA